MASVTCDFTNGTCMYYLHNVDIRDTSIYYGYYQQLAQYGNIAYMEESMCYLRSAPVNVVENSCLTFHFAILSSYSMSVVRVATFNSNSYHTVGQWELQPFNYYISAFVIYVNISSGQYDGILIEVQSYSMINYNEPKAVDNIQLFPGECTTGGVQVLNLLELISTTTTSFWEGNTNYGRTEWESETSTWPSTTPACSHDQFPCYNGTCIPILQICDGVPQCSHSEDELICLTTTPTVSTTWSTSTPRLTAPWVTSTPDSTTPHHTTMPTWSTTSSLGCLDGFIACYDGSCIHWFQLCDGNPDCLRGEDEQYCSTSGWTTHATGPTTPVGCQMCSDNSSCISPEQICDGTNDCADRMDENICEDYPSVRVSDPPATTISGSVDLVCTVENPGNHQVILFWKSLRWGDISRNGDLMVDISFKNLTRGKFSVHLTNNGTTTTYILTVGVVEQQDIHEDFTCISDIVGIPEVYWPYHSVRLNIQGDIP
ncbi:low-density lipoprotein receptor-related protein 1-like [Dreissena polymorpha]|nr:low-density lipoprotein receptor-related protein 1-like [Dreissena polymorpha]